MLELRNNLQKTNTMFSGKDGAENNKIMQKNKELQANQEHVTQMMKSTYGDEKPMQFTLQKAKMHAKRSETYLSKIDDMVQKWSTITSCTTPDHLLKNKEKEEEDEKETNEYVRANLFPGEEETKTSDTNTQTTEYAKHRFDRKVSTPEDSQTKGSERAFVETFEGESNGKNGFLERSHQDRDHGDSVQRITKQKASFSTGEGGPFKEVLSCNTSDITSVKTDKTVSNDKAKTCDFCKENALLICESCSIFCCEDCMETIHPNKGPYLKHKISSINSPGRSVHYERCRDHGLFAQLFCSYCERNRCTECVKTRCRLHFKGRISDADLENEKSLLREEFEKATAQLGFLERYKENVQQELANIQMTGLSRREQIRQEFVSFHDLLIQKEEKMLEQLDQEVSERVTHVINTLQASVESLESEDIILTTTVTELVHDTKFKEEYVRANDLCQQMNVRVKEFHRDWAKNSMYTPSPVLDNYFTMRREKRDLSEKLDEAMELPKLRFKQSTLFTYPNIPMCLSEFMESSGVPPSTDVSYTMQLFQRSILIYEKTSRNLQDLRLNDHSTYLLVPGLTVLLKVTSEFRCHDFQDKSIRRGNPCHMLISVLHVYPVKQLSFHNAGLANLEQLRIKTILGSPDLNGIGTTKTMWKVSQKESVDIPGIIIKKATRRIKR